MPNQPPKQYFYSLRLRYAGIAILFALIILASASFAYQSLSTARHSTTDSITNRHLLQQRTRHIRDAIWQAHEALQLFLFNPTKSVYQTKIHKSIANAIDQSDRLLERNWKMTSDPHEVLKELKKLLIKFDGTVERLIKIRTTATEQYPSLALARSTMLGLNDDFVTAASLAIDEAVAEDNPMRNRKVYRTLVEARHLWTQMISNFRMYLANRLGTFDNNVFATQINDIEIQYNGLQKQLKILVQLDKRNQLDLQGSTSLQTMLTVSGQWYKAYHQVRKIHESNAWRTDALLIVNEIEPLLEQIWQDLLEIDISMERTAEQNVGLLTRIAQYHVNSLWLAAGLALLFVITSYFLLDKSVLQPLFILTGALKAEAHGHNTYTLPNVKTLETQNLVDAFAEMRKQIHHRQNALEYQALHDSLTGLANRALLLDRLQQGIQHCSRHKTSLSLLIIDLDGFKEVNDTLGHQVGDRLLEEVGIRLSKTLREIDTVARLGGDEFAILLPEANEPEACEVTRKIQHALEEGFTVHDIQLYVSASIGIAVHPKHTDNVQDLIKFADIAMYVAKRNKLDYAVYDSSHDTHSPSQLALGSDLRNAIGSTAIQLVYQPKLDMRSHQVCGIEALFRWTHPTLGPVPAAEAIDLAEQTGFINQLTMWTTEEVARQQANWEKTGIRLPVSINLSVYSLQSDTVIEQILSRLAATDIEASEFVFEITESAMMVDPQHAIETIKRISKMGGQLSIDDFGTGFSSLNYLKQMPVNELKIDKSFVIDMLENDNDAIIVRSIIDLAHNLGLKVVAEGVENKHIWQLLQILDCDIAQGNHLCPPVTADKFIEWYQTYQSSDSLLETVS